MKKNQQQQTGKSTIVSIFSILLLIIMIVIFAIQISILIAFFLNSKIGRCVYKYDNNTEVCTMTSSKQCKKLKGSFNSELDCDDVYNSN
jgi:flagellar basal body-associated protein FliL